ncbi:MAG: Gfo/Idh/MocA family oxidoreductase [Candidatus Brocadiaceae bacterium]|nr:Gfo/Idh/MocA family oxidoreductase [Candidatus Brocadiaceae bacterium]
MGVPRIALVGGGTFGLMHLRAFRQFQHDGRCEFLALADVNERLLEERAREFGMRAYADYREMLERERPDAVAVATPDHLHREIALAALAQGAHVFVEKPMDTTVEGCTAMIEAGRDAGVLLQVDFHKRYDPYHAELRRSARQGKLGEIEYAYAWMEDRIEVPRSWLAAWAGESSPAWFLGIHMVDLVCWITGCGGRRVHATGVRKKLRSLGIDAWDSVCFSVEMDRDVTFQCQTSWVLPDAFEGIVNQGIRVVGTEGLMEVDSQDRGARCCFAADGRMATPNPGFFREGRDPCGRAVYGGYGIDAIRHFVDNVSFLMDGGALSDLAGTYPSGEDGREATRIVAGVHDALQRHAAVDL